jgi:hypothetical protein
MMKPITTRRDLDDARSQERAFIFLWVNWAIHARYSEIEVRRLLETWERGHPDCTAAAYRVDLSEQEGEIWNALGDWLRAESQPGQMMAAGAGALLWTRSGSIVASELYAANCGFEQLLAVTRRAFESGD